MIGQSIDYIREILTERNTGCIPEGRKHRVPSRIKQGRECIHEKSGLGNHYLLIPALDKPEF